MPRYSTKQKPKSASQKSLVPFWLALIGIGLVVIAGWAILSSKNQPKAAIEVTGSARLKVNNDTINHGDVKLGDTLTDTIEIANVGDQPLRFTEAPYIEVKEGC